jgi:hypothetical protein
MRRAVLLLLALASACARPFLPPPSKTPRCSIASTRGYRAKGEPVSPTNTYLQYIRGGRGE